MTARRACVAALLAACMGPLAACGADSGDSPSAPAPSVGAKMSHPAPVPSGLARLRLTDYRGKHLSLASLRGKVVVISDVLTLCQEVCPMETADLVRAARHAEKAGIGDKVEFLTITVDPRRDTPGRLAAYRKFFAKPGELPDWDLATGEPAGLKRLWKYFGVYVKRTKEDSPPAIDWMTHKPLTYDVEHSDQVIFLDHKTRERFVMVGHANLRHPHQLPARLRKFMSDEGRKNLRHPGAAAWTPQQVDKVVAWLTHTPAGSGSPTTRP